MPKIKESDQELIDLNLFLNKHFPEDMKAIAAMHAKKGEGFSPAHAAKLILTGNRPKPENNHISNLLDAWLNMMKMEKGLDEKDQEMILMEMKINRMKNNFWVEAAAAAVDLIKSVFEIDLDEMLAKTFFGPNSTQPMPEAPQPEPQAPVESAKPAEKSPGKKKAVKPKKKSTK